MFKFKIKILKVNQSFLSANNKPSLKNIHNF